MLLVYSLMIGALKHYGEAIRLNRYHKGLCTHLLKADGLKESVNLTLWCTNTMPRKISINFQDSFKIWLAHTGYNVRTHAIIRNVENHHISQSQRSCTLGSSPPIFWASDRVLLSKSTTTSCGHDFIWLPFIIPAWSVLQRWPETLHSETSFQTHLTGSSQSASPYVSMLGLIESER